MEKVFPVRFYGDGAEAFALNSFEMLTMISVAPKHSSSLKTRFVFLENNGCANFESVYITSNVSCGTLSFIYSHVSSEVYLHIYSWIDVFWFFKGTCEALHSELQLHKWCRSLPTDETDSLVFYCIVYLLWPLWELWNPLTFFGVFFSQKKWTQLALKAILVRFTWNSRLFRYRAVAHSWLRGQEIHQVPPPTLAQTGWKPDLWRLPLCVWRSSGRPRLSPQNFQFQANLYKFDSVIFCFVLWCGTGSANGRHVSQTNPKPTQMPRIMAQ